MTLIVGNRNVFGIKTRWWIRVNETVYRVLKVLAPEKRVFTILSYYPFYTKAFFSSPNRNLEIRMSMSIDLEKNEISEVPKDLNDPKDPKYSKDPKDPKNNTRVTNTNWVNLPLWDLWSMIAVHLLNDDLIRLALTCRPIGLVALKQLVKNLKMTNVASQRLIFQSILCEVSLPTDRVNVWMLNKMNMQVKTLNELALFCLPIASNER